MKTLSFIFPTNLILIMNLILHYGPTDLPCSMMRLSNMCADDVDLRILHKWFLRHPWKRYLNFDESSLLLKLVLMSDKVFLQINTRSVIRNVFILFCVLLSITFVAIANKF